MGGPQLKLAGGMWGRGLLHDGKCVEHIAAGAEHTAIVVHAGISGCPPQPVETLFSDTVEVYRV